MSIDIRFKKLKDSATLPIYQTPGSAGADICACLDSPMTIEPMARVIIPTGLSVEIPIGYEIQVRARSGLSIKNGLTLINGIGTIDSDYRGEIGVLMVNLGSEAFVVEPGMRVAQIVLTKYETINWAASEALTETDRGQGGFGSTGK